MLQNAEYADEWLTSAQSMGMADRHGERHRVLPWDRSAPVPSRKPTVNVANRASLSTERPRSEWEFEYEL